MVVVMTSFFCSFLIWEQRQTEFDCREYLSLLLVQERSNYEVQ